MGRGELMGLLSVLSMAHRFVKERVRPGDVVIDATCGTGVDTKFLVDLVGAKGTIYAFDIQQEALARTATRLENAHQKNVQLIHDSHARLRHYLHEQHIGQVSAIMFNLGYLPLEHVDQRIMTTTDSTICALKEALAVLKVGGIISIVLYPGHEGGDAEAVAVEQWCLQLPQVVASTAKYQFIQKHNAPYLIVMEKRSLS